MNQRKELLDIEGTQRLEQMRMKTTLSFWTRNLRENSKTKTPKCKIIDSCWDDDRKSIAIFKEE